MSGNNTASEQNNSNYETKASNLRLSEKKCCKFRQKGGAAVCQEFTWWMQL